MINVITSHGASFKGLAAYLLSDVDRQGDERVAWTETHGLATDDPERAYKIMIATAMSQADLKEEAGVANTGRKSHKHVMHYVLSWHPEERETLTKDEMLAAAKASMTYLGTYEGEKLGKGKTAKRTQHADEHQAVIVCHDDGPGENPHVHIMLNRVHPEHGVMLPDTKDYDKLSAWALDYRRAQGKDHYCPERTKAAAKKAQGIVTNNPRKPRNVYEQEQAIQAADPGSRRKAQLEQQIKKARALKARHEGMKQNQAEQMRTLEDRHVAAERAERIKTAEAIKARTAEIRAAYAPKIDAMLTRQSAEIDTFRAAKETASGRVRNTWAAFKTKEWMTDIRSRPLEAMKHGFSLAFSSGLQERDIKRAHGREVGELRGQRTGEEREAARELRTDQGFRLDDLRQSYHEARNDLMLRQGMETAKIKAEWKQLDRDRLASEIEDARGLDHNERSGGGRGNNPRDEEPARLGDESIAFKPANDNFYDIPIDELREIADSMKSDSGDGGPDQAIQEAGDLAGPAEPEQGPERDPDMER